MKGKYPQKRVNPTTMINHCLRDFQAGFEKTGVKEPYPHRDCRCISQDISYQRNRLSVAGVGQKPKRRNKNGCSDSLIPPFQFTQ